MVFGMKMSITSALIVYLEQKTFNLTISLSFLSLIELFPVVKQYFEVQVYDVFVMRGNTAIFKCQIPSFVSDHVDVTEWTSTENDTYRLTNDYGATKLTDYLSFPLSLFQLFKLIWFKFWFLQRQWTTTKSSLSYFDSFTLFHSNFCLSNHFSVVSHPHSVNVMDEHVLKGNSAILKCHIPSFVSDFVVIDAWIDEETGEEFRYDAGGQLGTDISFGSDLAFSIFFSICYIFCHNNFMFFIIILINLKPENFLSQLF